MKLISWNVNGIRSIQKKGFSSFVARQKPELLCVQEVKVGQDQIEAIPIELKNYQVHCSLAERRGYSGVATYTQDGTTLNKRTLKTGIGIERFDSEGRFLISKHKDFTLYNLYIPSGTSGDERQAYKYDYLDDFLAHIKKLQKKTSDKLIICGDFNICHKAIDIHHPKEAEERELTGFLPEERAWVDKFEASGFVDTFRHVHGNKPGQYSWWSYRAASREKNLGWRIDYIWVSKALVKRVKDARILKTVGGSDHCPVMITLS